MRGQNGLPIFIMALLLMQAILAQEPTTPTATNREGGFLLAGYGFTNFEKAEHELSNFSASFNPIMLWRPADRLLFESEVEFEVEEGTTEIGLEFAQIFYVLNDYITLGAGKFLSPNNNFMERLHPAWINKLPDMLFGVSGHGGVQLLASTQLGVQARGGIPLGASKLSYAIYVANGPTLNVEEDHGGATGEESVSSEGDEEGEGHGHGVGVPGTLNFSNSEDNNADKAIGGRIAFYPVPQLEIGYGFETAKVGSEGTHFADVRSTNHVVDFTYVTDVTPLKGRIDLRGQFIWLNVDNPNEEPLVFENKSTAGYGQIAYQPYLLESGFLKNVELVFRYDRLDLPEEALLNTDMKRVSFGLNYWLSASSAFKFAYERVTETGNEGEEETEGKFIGQFTLGF
ncbi:MAG: hypothetical protein D6681_09805 [Calditrichaeota bacterium]|nr:MAG: hypothetical protein D6681_09805 [Calditrichota bacterium]